MNLYCSHCEEYTQHDFQYSNEHTGESTYACIHCANTQEVEQSEED
jgi:hypothetical protein